jgi:hypothetical protein
MPSDVILNLHDADPGTLEELIRAGQDRHLLTLDIALHQIDFRIAKVGNDRLEGKCPHDSGTRTPAIHVANTAAAAFTSHECHITSSVAHRCFEHSNATMPLEARA